MIFSKLVRLTCRVALQGGSSVIDAARYQIMIIYLISACSFGTVFTQLYSMLRICFDSRMILRTDRLKKRAVKSSALSMIKKLCEATVAYFHTARKHDRGLSSSSLPMGEESKYLAPKGEIRIVTSAQIGNVDKASIGVSNLAYSFEKGEDVAMEKQGQQNLETEIVLTRRTLFQDLSLEVQLGDEALIDGPSGVGKSTLLRILAGLAAADEGTIELFGRKMSTFRDMSSWRRQVLYVPQTKVDIPGTPFDLMKKICSFSARARDKAPSTYTNMKAKTVQLLSDWGMDIALLDSEWKILSGGESQRVLIAIALASCPRVMLLDESTSAMDSWSKMRVEASVKKQCAESGMSAIWITHDQAQKERLVKST